VINRTVAQGSGVSSFDWFRFAVFNNPSWDYTTLNFDSDVALNNTFAPITNSTDPNLFPMRARGGKPSCITATPTRLFRRRTRSTLPEPWSTSKCSKCRGARSRV
jgi:hypothetical protein